uniref:Hmbx-1 n=1 Tax=Pristionchus pacificus TaxID=54126 RepID=A0A2A6BKH1_PRIPA|eukprot:PDM66387.1 hmbx-1 [Pristionchus pacificus]
MLNPLVWSGFAAGPMSLYTVEQLELIRRLKNTGISLEAVVDAFTAINTIKSELDAAMTQSAALAYLSPATSAAPAAAAAAAAASVSEPPTPSPVLVPASMPGPSLVPVQQAPAPVPTTPVHLVPNSIETTLASLMPSPAAVSSSMFLALQGSPLPLAPPSSMLHNSLAAAIAATQQAAAAAAAAQQQQQQQPRLQTPPTPAPSNPSANAASTSGEVELEDFMSQGEEGCIADMKSFITHYSLRQTTVAMMTGVSQPYISKLLNGNHRELSLRCRKNIYCWYLNCRRHPEKLTTTCFRYVFRPVLLRLLDQFFTETPFPDTQRRQEIANACNAALQQDKKGVQLMPKEVVSPQVVSNWFANKRKELRRKTDPRYQEPLIGMHPALIEMLEAGSGSVPEPSDNGSASPGDDDTMDCMELSTPTEPSATVPRQQFPPPGFGIFEALGLAVPGSLYQPVKSEALEIKDQF